MTTRHTEITYVAQHHSAITLFFVAMDTKPGTTEAGTYETVHTPAFDTSEAGCAARWKVWT